MPGWNGRAHVVRALDGGITNRNLLVAVGEQHHVFRVAGNDTNLLEIRRDVEHQAATRAARLGIAPPVTAFLEPEGYLVTEFVTAQALSSDEMRQTDRIRQIAALLRTFHATAPLAGDFDAFAVPHLHAAAAQSRGVEVPEPDFVKATEAAERIRHAFAASPEGHRPCHNDLLNANFLVDGARIWLLDWEYAGNNDRYFDLGNLCVNNSFDEAERDELLTAYFGSASVRRRARLRLMMIMSDFREAMWAVVQQGISTLDFDYRAYAARHFDRLHGAVADAEFESWLVAATAGEPDA